MYPRFQKTQILTLSSGLETKNNIIHSNTDKKDKTIPPSSSKIKYLIGIFILCSICLFIGFCIGNNQFILLQHGFAYTTISQQQQLFNLTEIADLPDIILQMNFREFPVWMKDDEKILFSEIILALDEKLKNETKRYLEWGSGGSTELISMLGTNINSKFYSIEHAPAWCHKMLQEKIIQYAINMGKLQYECVDTEQPLVRWGRPAKYANIAAMTPYVDRIDELNEERYDIVLIDGRFRVECALKLLIGEYIDEDSIIMIHDYFIRNIYFDVEKYYNLIKRRTYSLAVFQVKKNFFKNDTFIQMAKDDFKKYRLNYAR